MPGLSQLKQFTNDMIALGNESSLRAARGERPVRVPIPKTIKDFNDADDFIVGMPENEIEPEITPVDNDLSDIINPGLSADSKNADSSGEQSSKGFDLSSLISPVSNDDSESNDGEPDLSAFLDEPEPEEEEIIEEEPEEKPVSIADMNLEDLLSGTGFDGSDISEIEDTKVQQKINSDEYYTDEELEKVAAPAKLPKNEKNHSFNHSENLGKAFDFDFDSPSSTEANDSQKSSENITDIDESVLNDLKGIPGLDLSDMGIQTSEKIEEPAEDLLDLEEEAKDEPADEPIEELTDLEEENSGDLSENNGFDDLDYGSFEDNNPAENTDEEIKSDSIFGKINLDDFPDADISNVTEPLNDFDYPDENQVMEKPITESEDAEVDEALNNIEDISSDNSTAEDFNLDDIPSIDFDSSENNDFSDILSDAEEAETAEKTENPEKIEKNDTQNNSIDLDDLDSPVDSGILDELEDIGSFDETNDSEKADSPDILNNLDSDNSADLNNTGDIEDLSSVDDTDNLEELSDTTESVDLEDLDSLDNLETADSNALEENPQNIDLDDINLDEINLDDFNTDSQNNSSETAPSENINLEDINLDDFDLTDSSSGTETESNSDNEEIPVLDDSNLGNVETDAVSDLDDLSPLEEESSQNTEIPVVDGLENLDSGNKDETAAQTDSGTDDFASMDLDMPDFESSVPDAEESIPAEGEETDPFTDFDASELEGLDFTTSSDNSGNSENASGEGFDLGNADDFALEGSDFEIEGFTDVDIAKEERRGPKLPSPDFSGALEGTKLPPNTLSDEQYKQFLENLKEYPLNVRLAFEDLIVKDEFTDDAEFEIIEKVLNKVPARQLAATLEKMLDISLPVPRDYEHRTAAEYDAYKKSLEYQLRNKIIPGALVCILLMLVGIGIFNFVKHCIYRPLKASSLYKQGYALLQENEYPQSEMKFNEAVEFKINKKWFFNYARGYRAHKQYQRSENIYDRILKDFNHDKAAGLEYANMELYDLANYSKAEEIIRRDILDYHVNDPDGLLLLGDNFLEWGTEKDSEKFESARQQYATLINLYGSKDLYLSRMMRYFVRTDNLQQVLTLKKTFENNKKFKYDSDDITEVSGYLLDKLYGPVSPAEEYLRNQIEGLRGMLLTAVQLNQNNPTAWYNLSRYYIDTKENSSIENALQRTILEYNNADALKTKDIYNYIDSYRLLGEYYVEKEDYLKAQEQYTEGISLYTTERDNAGFGGSQKIGQLYSDLADINYFVSKEYKQALTNYEHAVKLDFDNPKIRYRIGYIQYRNKKYEEALGSFMMASEGNARRKNLLLAMANTLSLRGDDYAASGYYETLISMLNDEINDEGIVFPQSSAKHNELVTKYLNAANNYGVTLHRLAVRTGNSSLNAEAIVQFQQSVRAWDALTRNQDTLVKLDGSNLALENIRYVTNPYPDYEPAIYTDIDKVLSENEGIK